MLDAKFYILLCGWLDFFFFVILEESVQVPWVWLLRALQTLLLNRALQTLHINVKPARVTNSGQD